MANRYFLNIGSNWNDTANWSDASGGTGGFSVPSNSDDVFFDANSGSCAVDATSSCDDLTFTGYVGTFSGSQDLDIYGSLVLAAGMTYSFTGDITFRATSTGKTITLGGKTTASTVVFDGVGGGWTVQDAWNNSTRSIALDRGSLDTNDQTITCTQIDGSGTATRTLDLGSSTLNITSWSFATVTNLTFTVGTSTINITNSNFSNVFAGGGLTYNVVSITTGSINTHNLTGANTFGTLTITGSASKSKVISLAASQTVSGTLTIAGNSLTNRLLIQSDTLGTARTITAATTTISNCDFMDITASGAGSWSGTSIGNALGNSGITFTTPVTRYAVVAGSWSNTATWSATSGGVGGASVPLCHDTVILNASSAAGTYTADMQQLGADITCTGFTRTLTTSNTGNIFGSLTLVSGMTFTPTALTINFYGRSSHTLTTGGKSLSTASTNFVGFGGTYTLQDSFTSTGSLGIYNGTFSANNQDISVTSLLTSTTTTRTITMGSGTWTLTGTGTVWSGATTTGLTLNQNTSTIIISNTSATSKTFAGGGKTFNTLRFTGAGTGTYIISGSNTFSTLESTKTNAYTINFTTGTTQTVTNWSVSGSSGNVVTINSTTTGTHALVKAGGGEVRSDYLSIQHSIATPSNTWYAGVNSTDNQAVVTAGSGWLFTVPLPTCTTQAVSSISDLSATANGNSTDDGSGIISERGFVYDTTSRGEPGNLAPASTAYVSSVIDTGTFSEGAFTGSLTGLTELTTYYVRAYCKNQAGYDYGTEVSFTTLETPAVPIVSTQAVTVVSGTTAVGNGTVISDEGSTLTRRGFVYSTTPQSNPGDISPGASAYSDVEDESGTFGEEAFGLTITGLSNDTTYYLRAFAENGVGFAYGDEVSFMTDRLPGVTIQNPTNRQSETTTLNGTITDAGGDTITLRGFVWDLATQTAPGNVAPASSGYDFNQSEVVSTTEGTFNEDITGLSPNTTYYTRAFAQNSLGYTYSNESQFTTIAFPNTTTMVNLDTNTTTVNNTESQVESGIINQSTTTSSVTNTTL